MLADLNPKAEAKTEPAKKWFSWWRTRRDVRLEHPSGTTHLGPNTVFVCGPYPSKDAAHTEALEVIAENAWNSEGVSYLGSYPEGERP